MSKSHKQRLAAFAWVVLAIASARVAAADPSAGNPLSDEALANATYKGLEVDANSVTLSDGYWEGEPYLPDSVMAPRLQLLSQLIARGDISGDGVEEAVVLLNFAPGGTGQLLHLAVMGDRSGTASQLAAVFVGDRVKVRDLAIRSGTIVLDVLPASSRDASCCPGELATRQWQFSEGKLVEVDAGIQPERLTPAVLAGTRWRLSSWNHDEPVSDSTAITLSYEDGRIVGNAGCNNYFAPVTVGSSPGAITFGAAGATRMACRDPEQAEAEHRFLTLLPTVSQFSWNIGQLIMPYGDGEAMGVLFFDRQ